MTGLPEHDKPAPSGASGAVIHRVGQTMEQEVEPVHGATGGFFLRKGSVEREPPPLPGGDTGGVPSSLPPTFVSNAVNRGPRVPAFSLLELMIGIVVLGLGMVMVATMFPVAWHRARSLNEYTVQKTTTLAAHDTIKSLLRVAGPFEPSSFAGDLILDPVAWQMSGRVQSVSVSLGGVHTGWPSDDWVHALNMENIQVEERRFVDEDPWEIERAADLGDSNLELAQEFRDHSYDTAQIRFHQRVYPPLERHRDGVDDDRVFEGSDNEWDGWLDARRFCWATFHRLREPVITGGVPISVSDARVTRSFDIYHVILRRPQPTHRYARQDPGPASRPNPYRLTATPDVIPAPRPKEYDVMVPVPWRVQVQFPTTLPLRSAPTGIPTEIEVPPPLLAGTPSGVMLVQMFPRGAWFIDEITGAVYRVVRRRVTGDDADQAFLTLDREVYLEDLDLPFNDGRCVGCVPVDPAAPAADPEELLRTVWVFPPAAQASRLSSSQGETLVFVGSQPVVEIDVRTLRLSPSK